MIVLEFAFIFFFSQPAFLKLYFYLLYRALAAQDDLCPTLAVSSMTEGRSSPLMPWVSVGSLRTSLGLGSSSVGLGKS